MGGVNSWYSALYDKCTESASRYFQIVNDHLVHVGDEFLTTVALASLKKEVAPIYNAGALNIIHRYWGMAEHRLPSDYHTLLLHFPSDKQWLSSLALSAVNSPTDFYRQYRRHRSWLKVKKLIKKVIHRK